MLAELLHFALTPASMAARRDGSVADSVALWARGHRQRRAWAAHETHARAVAEAAIGELRQTRTAVVLGSGLLRDVPIELLRARFERVVLVDLVHLASVRLRALLGRWGNVEFMVRDIAGGEEGRDEGGDSGASPLAFLRSIPDLDLVISANVLSQIGVAARARAEEIAGADLDGPLADVARRLRRHLDALAGLGARAVLITDIAYRVRDRAGGEIEHYDLMHGVALPPADARWEWPVAPFGEIRRDIERVHDVVAHGDFGRAWSAGVGSPPDADRG